MVAFLLQNAIIYTGNNKYRTLILAHLLKVQRKQVDSSLSKTYNVNLLLTTMSTGSHVNKDSSLRNAQQCIQNIS